MDALSQTLRVVRLVGAIFINAKFTAPWSYKSPEAATAAPLLEPGAERVVIFHLITEGECYVELADQPAVRLRSRRCSGFSSGRCACDVLISGCSACARCPLGSSARATAASAHLWRRRGDDPIGVRLSRMRSATRANALRRFAGSAEGQCPRIECRCVARGVAAICACGSPLAPSGRRRRAGEARRGPLHRGAASLHERAERRPNRLAGRGRGSHRRRCAECTACTAGARLDSGGAGAGFRHLAIRAGGAVRRSWSAALRCST